MTLRRRFFCGVGASMLSSQLLIQNGSAQNEIPVSGQLTAQADTDVSGLEFRLSSTERKDRTDITLDSDGEITTTISEPGTFRVTVFDYSSNINKLPAVYSFPEITIGEDGDIGEFTLPSAYVLDIQCLDTVDNPIENLPVNFRAPNGTGMAPGTFTTTADGYVKYPSADQTGVEVVDTIDIEVQHPDDPDLREHLQTVTVSASGRIGVTVSNPDRFTVEDRSSNTNIGVLSLAGLMTGCGYVAWRWRSKRQTNTQQPTETEPSTASSSESSEQDLEAHQTAAETAIETAGTAEMNDEYGDAVAAYREAISEYQAALSLLDAGAVEQRTEIEQAIESVRAELKPVAALQEHRTEIIEALQPAERSFQEAVVASMQADQTVARIRFRQARDSYADARKILTDSEVDLLTEPIEVSVTPDREPPSTTLSDLPAISEETALSLANAGIETTTDLASRAESPWMPAAVEGLVANDTIEEDVATILTMVSWWHGDDTYVFETPEAIETREQQADYGFNHTS